MLSVPAGILIRGKAAVLKMSGAYVLHCTVLRSRPTLLDCGSCAASSATWVTIQPLNERYLGKPWGQLVIGGPTTPR